MAASNKIILKPTQIAYIKANFYTKTNRELADYLGLKLTTLRTRCYNLGLKRMDLEYWTKEQVTYLKKYYKRIGDTEIAATFNKKYHKNKGWSKKHIEKKRRYLNLKRTPQQRQQIKQRNIEKGMFKMCPVKAWQTRGGAAPEKTIKIWLVAGTPQKFIKINTQFIKLSRYNWEQHYNKKARKGYCIIFKDGNTMNCEVENLQRITRKENILRNSTQYHQLPEELKTVIKLNNKLKKLINNDNATRKSA